MDASRLIPEWRSEFGRRGGRLGRLAVEDRKEVRAGAVLEPNRELEALAGVDGHRSSECRDASR